MAPLFFIVIIILLFLSGAGSVRTVSRLTVVAGGSVTIPCHYETEYKAHVKYWCKGGAWIGCGIIVKTDSPQRDGDASISDDPERQVLTLTLRDLQDRDSGRYWCAVQIGGAFKPDHKNFLDLKVTVGTPDLSALNSTVTGVEGGSLSILCRYSDHLRGKRRWCRLTEGISCLEAGETGAGPSGARVEVNDTRGLLTVTLWGLQSEDSGWYWCEAGDQQALVNVLVRNASTTTIPKATTTVTTSQISKSGLDLTTIALLLTLALLLLLVTVTVVSCRLWSRSKKTQVERRQANHSTKVTDIKDQSKPATKQAGSPSKGAAVSSEVTYSVIVRQHEQTGAQAPPPSMPQSDDVTYSVLAPQ